MNSAEMAAAVAAILGGPARGPRRERDPGPPPPVRRGSQRVGTVEAELWEPTPPAWLDAVQAGARELSRQLWRDRCAGREGPRLGRLAVALLGELVRLVDWGTGRLDPSYEELAERVGASRSGVARALVELRVAGLLAWVRRYEPTGQEEGAGPRVRQVSNAYRLTLPPAAEAALARAGGVAAALVERGRTARAAARAAREARWAEARRAAWAERERLVEARERAAQRWTGPLVSDRDRWAHVLSSVSFARPERESSS